MYKLRTLCHRFSMCTFTIRTAVTTTLVNIYVLLKAFKAPVCTLPPMHSHTPGTPGAPWSHPTNTEASFKGARMTMTGGWGGGADYTTPFVQSGNDKEAPAQGLFH